MTTYIIYTLLHVYSNHICVTIVKSCSNDLSQEVMLKYPHIELHL